MFRSNAVARIEYRLWTRNKKSTDMYVCFEYFKENASCYNTTGNSGDEGALFVQNDDARKVRICGDLVLHLLLHKAWRRRCDL